MRRADRLFQIIQTLRSRHTTAADLEGRLGFCERTVYRDIRDRGLEGLLDALAADRRDSL